MKLSPVFLLALICFSTVLVVANAAKEFDRKALERLVRERIAKKNAEEALEKAVDIEVNNLVDEVTQENTGDTDSSTEENDVVRADQNAQNSNLAATEVNDDSATGMKAGDDSTTVAKAVKKERKINSIDNVMADVLDVTDDVNLGVATKRTSSDIDQIYWCSDGVVLMRTTRGQVFRSADNGLNWVDLTADLKSLKGAGSVVIDRIEVNPVDSGQVVLVGRGPFGFISNDAAQTFVVYSQLTASSVLFHPTEKSWLLALALTPDCDSTSNLKSGTCYQQLMYSHDLGASWTKIADYVSSADWQRVNLQDESAKDTILACINRVKNGDQSFTSHSGIDLYSSSDYFATPASLILANAESFVQPNSHLIYAAVAVQGRNSKNLINLYVSVPQNGEPLTFTRVNLPTLGQRSFTIVDASEESVFIHINHDDVNDPSGSVYMSDSTGLQFSLSLPNNRRSSEGVADFQCINGIEGVFLANYLHHEDSSGAVVNQWQGFGRKLDRSSAAIRTAITFDKGAVWSYLTPPKYDALGNDIACAQNQECFLHLHGVSDRYGAMHSSGTAVGLIMATGSIGDGLGEIGTATYLSRDAGLTWQQVAKGSHIYQFGNHGALIVMAPNTAPTDHVLYSWDQALTWYKVKISKTPIQVSKIVTDPSGGSQNFLIQCSDASGDGIIAHLDLSGLHERVCEDQDFENWTPVDDRGESSCIMGHKISYTRRKRESKCYNPMKYQVGQFHGDCPCTDRDFECDVGFARNNDVCERVDDLVQAIEDQCDSKGVHRVTKGYRRIPGNSCVGGEKWDQQIISCSVFPKKSGHALLLTLFTIAVVLAVVMFLSKNNLTSRCLDRCQSKFRIFKYLSLDKKTISDAEFEEFEFGTTPACHIDDEFDRDLHDIDELQSSPPIPPLPGLVQRQNGPIPRIQGPKSNNVGSEA